MKLHVGLLQMVSRGLDQRANLEKGDAFCRRAKNLGADIALFPEMWNIGYTFFESDAAREQWATNAILTDSTFVKHFQNLAQELDMAIALTYLQARSPLPRNVVSLIDRRGEILFTYAKVHTCDFDKEAALTPGEEFYVADLDAAHGNVRVGAMICFDREFPESACVLMLQGAEILLVPNACEMEINRTTQLRACAFENMCGIALANYAAPQERGHSQAYDGMAFDEHGSRDMCVVDADASENVFIAEFDVDALRAYRAVEVWGNAYRKPRAYRALCEDAANQPFVRADARR
jgi:predicted amidohydrolase